jgi:hypothetical protein
MPIVSPSTKVSEISVSGRPYYRAFFEELGRLGYVEGQNLGVERYSGEGHPERYAELAHEVVNTPCLGIGNPVCANEAFNVRMTESRVRPAFLLQPTERRRLKQRFIRSRQSSRPPIMARERSTQRRRRERNGGEKQHRLNVRHQPHAEAYPHCKLSRGPTMNTQKLTAD